MFSLTLLIWLYIPVLIALLILGLSMMPRKQAAVMLIVKDGKILSISRRDDHTKFGLIGGSVENDETPEEAAIRETKEECDVDVHSAKLIFSASEKKNAKGKFYTYCYFAESWSGEPKTSEEGIVCWLTADELIGQKASFADYNKQAIKEFQKLYPLVTLTKE